MYEVMRFTVALASHADVMRGDVETAWVDVAVAARTYAEGECTAAQFACALQSIRGREAQMPTATYPFI